MYKRDFIWNSIAGLINAAEAVVMAIMVTRITNLSDAGILTIAFAVGNLLMSVGKLGVRNYQVTDVKMQYKYETYFTMRIISVLLMMLLSVSYVTAKMMLFSESFFKEGCILAICAIYIIESFEDVIWGEFQRKKRLDIGAKIFVTRWCAIFFTFAISLFFNHNLFVSLWLCFVTSFICFLTMTNIYEKKYNLECGKNQQIYLWKIQRNKKNLYKLLGQVYPLFLVSFLAFYINNSAKYALDVYVDNETQACYGFVSMPVFVIGLLNGMIYQPSVVWLSEQWTKGNKNIFIGKIRKQCLIILAISIICIIGVASIGIPVLSVLYSTNLKNYWKELVILQFAGMFLALSGYMVLILTIMRMQKALLFGYSIVFFVSLLGMKFMAYKYGTIGVSMYYLFCIILLFMIYALIFLKNYNMEKE